MKFSEVEALHKEVDAEMELILAYCEENELENLPWDDLLELAKDRDEEAASVFEAEMEEQTLDLEAGFND